MTQKTFSMTAGVVFSLIALAHIFRVAFQVEWVLQGVTVPMWASWVALFIAGFLAYEGFRVGAKSPSGASR